MSRRSLSVFLAAALFALAGFAQALPKGVQKVTSVEGITEYSLPNGLKVLLFPDPSKPKVTVNMTYLVGSRHEGYGETGMAHLLEHVMFIKTKTRDDIKKELTDHGAQFNGSTDWDRTNYFETVNATDENLRWALALEADRMVNCRIEKAVMDPEMTVVRNEFEMGENSPERMLMQRVLEAAYTFHNYGKLPIGARSDIENVPYTRLTAFYQKYYQPDNAVLMVAGQIDEPKTLALIADTFAKVPKPTRVLEKTYTQEPTQDGERTVILRRVGDVQAVAALYHVPAGTHPDTAALNVLSEILGDVPSGRLYKALVDNKKAASVSMGNEEMHDPGFAIAMARVLPDKSLDEAKQILLKTVEGLVNEPPTKEEVERAKTRILKQVELSLTNSQMIGVTMSEYAAMGDWRMMFLGRDLIKKVTPEDVLRVAKAYYKESNRTLGEFVPTKNPDRAEIPAAPDVAVLLKDYKGGEAVAQGEAFDPTPANLEKRAIRSQLSNGMKTVLLPKTTRGGTVVANINLRFGDEKSLFGKDAAASMAGSMLMRGTKNKTRQQIQDEMDKLKARISVNGSASGASASIETTEANLPGALRLVAEILREPSFPDNEFEPMRQQRLAQYESMKSEPQMLASLSLQRHLNTFPKGDPRYVGTIQEEIDEIKGVTLDQARDFYKQFYGADHGVFVVSGQFNKDQVQKLAEELFGNWKSPVRFERLKSPYSQVATVNEKIETPDKQNAMFVAAMKIKMNDEHPDMPALILANYMLGGSAGSRMFSRIRSKEGLSYGTGSQFSAPPIDDGGMFYAMAISAPQNTPKVEASFKDELDQIAKNGFTADEIATAKKSWLEQQKIRYSQDQTVAQILASQAMFDRTMKWSEDYQAKVAAVTPEQVNAAFRKYILPAGLTIYKAGDFKKAGVFQN
jgi:zinc protease